MHLSLSSITFLDLIFLDKGGNAVDAAIAVGFSLTATLPRAGNIGGGGFMVARTYEGEIVTLDFREKAPTLSYETMFLDQDGKYSRNLALLSHKSSGVPGTVDGLIRALEDYGSGDNSLREAINPEIKNIINGDPYTIYFR